MTIEVEYGQIRSVEELGRIARAHRKQRKLTLERISGLSTLSLRFLSEFERGKETAEIGKVLKALGILGLEIIVQPRSGRLNMHRAALVATPKTKPALEASSQLKVKRRKPKEEGV